MTQQLSTHHDVWDTLTPLAARVMLKPAAPATGAVDGAWWPRGRELAAELPALFAAVSERLGRVVNVTYRFDGWDGAPTRMLFDGNGIKLSGYHYQAADTVSIGGRGRRRLTLLVVAAQTDPETARAILSAAAVSGNTSTTGELLGVVTMPRVETGEESDWDSEGGALDRLLARR
ncbi:DUF5994 family protein [Aldersonia sp. NBC_00410]|uniref:DUF5994 family protein n=1 Tax=Aldersonia sp. NBC_00410 TaxID=2975954 RepID=UPI002252C9A2|nr:DUF5994 family protein [Aldersonia sp. NBC_00410]MCX5042175.1 DUF5994 family protein [Aldersonia sp. NBC_00410]